MEEFTAQDENETNYDDKTETLFEDKTHYYEEFAWEGGGPGGGPKENHVNHGAG